MKVKVIKTSGGESVDARIRLPGKLTLPSITDGWRFNFKSNTKNEKLQTYVLVCDETSNVIEGCLSFKMKDKVEPYMAYIEIAPHNKGASRRFDAVAACLIAFACRLSFTLGEGGYKGWLAFDVLEERKADEQRLMQLYSTKYGALRWGHATTMVIPPDGGEKLIEEYLTY